MSSEAPDYRTGLKLAGVPEANAPTILAAAKQSVARTLEARAALASLDQHSGVSVIAFGSLGRYEMTQASDLDLVYVRALAPANVCTSGMRRPT